MSEQSEMPRTRDERSLFRFFVRPKGQAKMVLFMIIYGVAAQICIAVGLLFFFESTFENLILAKQLEPSIALDIIAMLAIPVYSLMGVNVLLGVFVSMYTLKLSHRIYGPMIPLHRQIDTLLAGDFTARMHLRKEDEFKEVSDSLNRLAENLQNNYIKK